MALSRTNRRVPHTPDFLCSFVDSRVFMRLSLKRAAQAVPSKAAYRKFGASRSFFARCGIPKLSPSSLSRSSQLRRGAPRSHQRTWAENDGRGPAQPFVSTLAFVIFRSNPSRIWGSGVERSPCGCSFMEMFLAELSGVKGPPSQSEITISNCSPSCNSIPSPSKTVVCSLLLSKRTPTNFPRTFAVTREPVEASAHDLHGKLPARVCIVNVTLPVCVRFTE
jgi:hypothetical protein